MNLEILEGEMFALIGRSGLGKSVLLKHIIGIMKPDSGDIFVDDQNVRSLRGKQLEAMRRKFGYLFQEGALFDSMTVFENIAFPLREKTAMKEAKSRSVFLSSLSIWALRMTAHKFPAELSGGMRKRTSLARAMIMQPSIMLFDEPTTGLDPIIGQSILNYIQLCHRRLGFTGIIVTHDVPRVFSIVQKIAMIYQGEIIVCDSPEALQQQKDPILTSLSGVTARARFSIFKVLRRRSRMKRFDTEVMVGLFMIVGILSLGYLSINLGKMEIIGSRGYQVYADFPTVGGLKLGAQVEIAGIEIGRVKGMTLQDYKARVLMDIDEGVALQDDTIISIKTKGLLGEKFIAVQPGASDDIIQPGGRIREAYPPVDIEDLISKFAFGQVEDK